MAGEGVRTRGAAAADEPDGTEPGIGERRAAKGSRCVEVTLSGGAPWGFTLRGGQEHREPLLITKIEEGSKAAAAGKLQVGDELVSINDVVLTGFRQEAICLVKGSHRVLKMVVRRRNEPVVRPHSWHSTKFTDSPQDPATMQLSSSGVCSSWHSRYHTTSSSNSLSDPWDQPNLHHISHQFSSLGSMDSLDQTPALSLSLSLAKSNTSVEQAAQPNRRDSAYSSFSTNCSTPDYSLSSSRSDNGSSTENVLSRLGGWEGGRLGQVPLEDGGPEERKSPRVEEQANFRGLRTSLGPVWHVPEKRVLADSRGPRGTSPPPPPIRSDSYAATKVHEGGGQVRSRSHLRGDKEAMEGSGWRNQACPPCPEHPPAPASLDSVSSHPPPPPHHRQQHSDELAPAWTVTWRQDPTQAWAGASPVPPPCLDSAVPEGPGPSRYFCLTSGPPQQLAVEGQGRLRPEPRDGQKGLLCHPDPASRHLPEEVSQKPNWVSQRMGGAGTGSWASDPQAGEDCRPGPGVVCPEQAPAFPLPAQDGRRPQAEPGQVARQSRRSDRFATALRNEIQMKRALLQKSRSVAALAVSPEAGEGTECGWGGEPSAGAVPWPDGTSYADGLKEAQARVLRATSFQRRDLGPLATPLRPARPPPCPAPPPRNGPPPPPLANPLVTGRAASGQLGRVGGRKRLTQEQRLRSYSEPGKMNEVGTPEGEEPLPPLGTAPLASFADRRQFFEGSIKAAQPLAACTRPAPASGEVAHWKSQAIGPKAGEQGPESEVRGRAASLGMDGSWGGPHQTGGRSQGSAGAHPSGFPERAGQGGAPGTREREADLQRLGTFAEYQAKWREQRKLSEARSSSRYHSVDNILDQGCEQPAKLQYVHERSRSSPSTDFYLQDIPIEARRRPEGFQKEMAHPTTEAGASACRRRHLDSGSLESRAEGQQFHTKTKLGQTWPERTAQTREHLPQERHGHPVNMLSGNHYPEEPEVQEGWRAEGDTPDPCPQGQELSQTWAAAEEEENLAAASTKRAVDGHSQQEPHSPAVPPTRTAPLDQAYQGTTRAPTDLLQGSEGSAGSDLHEARLGRGPVEGAARLGNTRGDEGSEGSPAFHCLPTPTVDAPRSPSPQFAPQRLTDKPPLALEDDSQSKIKKVMENNTTVKKVPIKIVRSESQTEKENRHNLLNNVDLINFPSNEQPKSIGNHEHPYSVFAAYSRQEQEWLAEVNQKTIGDSRVSEGASPAHDCPKAKEKSEEDIKSEELVREIVIKDRSLADILYLNSKMKTTMDLMEGIFPKDENLLEEAQQRRKLLPRLHSPKATEEREEESMPIGASLTTSSTYYSTSAPKAELLNKLKDMQQQMEEEEDSEDELSADLTEKKQELIDSISKKLQVLREARESLQDDIQANNLLGDEVESVVKQVCKPNEFDKFRMFIGDLDKVVNLLLSLSGRLARVENALNTLEEDASPDERRTLTQKQKLLTRQHEDAKELKENLDRRERLVFDILSSYLTDELLQDYEHFVKMKSALTIEQRELEDKIKLGEEQLKCLLESLPFDCRSK